MPPGVPIDKRHLCKSCLDGFVELVDPRKVGIIDSPEWFRRLEEFKQEQKEVICATSDKVG